MQMILLKLIGLFSIGISYELRMLKREENFNSQSQLYCTYRNNYRLMLSKCIVQSMRYCGYGKGL